jgi:hypothetical protein
MLLYSLLVMILLESSQIFAGALKNVCGLKLQRFIQDGDNARVSV